MVWLDGGDHEAALACFEEACTVDGANASVHFCKTVALVKVCMSAWPPEIGRQATHTKGFPTVVGIKSQLLGGFVGTL